MKSMKLGTGFWLAWGWQCFSRWAFCAPRGTTDVAPTIDVTANFSEKVMDTSINGNTFKLLLKEGTTTTKIPASVSYNADIDPLTATLDPNEPLRRGAAYKAVITTRAKDLAGNSLDQSSTAGSQQKAWSFTTSN
jgi:Bacterial Ig-like domain